MGLLFLGVLCPWLHLHAHGTFHDLMIDVNRKIEAQPDDASLYLRRADIYLEHEEWQPCLIEIERVERMAPGAFPTDLTRGRALALAGRWELSKLSLDAFLESHADHPFGLLERARAFNALKQDTECLADYRKALATMPHPEPDLFHEVAEALWQRHQRDEAVQVLDRGIKQLGNVPQLVVKAMEREVETRRFDHALTRVAVLQASMPRPEPWMARRASILAQAGRMEESTQAWQDLLKHISALPNLERGSNAMCLLMEQAQTAVSSLSSLSSTSAASTIPSTPARP